MEKELSILNIFYIKTSRLPRAFPCLDCHSMRSSCSSQVIIPWLHSALLLAGNRWFIQHNIRGRIIINQRRNNKIIIVPQGLWICETLSTVSSSNPISKLLVNYPSPRLKVSELFTKYSIGRTVIFFLENISLDGCYNILT